MWTVQAGSVHPMGRARCCLQWRGCLLYTSYTLLDIDRGVPEVWGSKYDVREILRACYYAIDKKPLLEAELPFAEKELLKLVIKKVKGTDLELLLKDSGLIQ